MKKTKSPIHQNIDTKFVFPLVESAIVIKNAT